MRGRGLVRPSVRQHPLGKHGKDKRTRADLRVAMTAHSLLLRIPFTQDRNERPRATAFVMATPRQASAQQWYSSARMSTIR